ncbi:hypothetical protein [Frigoribacterium sp. CG_9.8]|uniref:hypothetical protein n=1 Tax=Frigoribacterium sp. CG_9.8 TaxID=2787733 RepID=UPI0018CAF117|nr:hypothetical protein [Frigoribacterium sp. CG_9.8]
MDQEEKHELLNGYDQWKRRVGQAEPDVSPNAYLLTLHTEKMFTALAEAVTSANASVERLESIIVEELNSGDSGSGELTTGLQSIVAELRTIRYP